MHRALKLAITVTMSIAGLLIYHATSATHASRIQLQTTMGLTAPFIPSGGQIPDDVAIPIIFATTTTTSTTVAPRPPETAASRSAPPKPTPVTTEPETRFDGGTVWDRLAECEATGNWARNSGNGYYGGLQMDMNFWHSYGPHAYDKDDNDLGLVAARPDLATREQQIAAAEQARDSGRGYSPWPACSRALGLR